MTVHLAVALTGTGWHPASWRDPATSPTTVLRADHWTDLVLLAEAGRLDFVTFEDAFGADDLGPDVLQGRLDATLVAARVAPSTGRIGLVPTVLTGATEPFHVSKAIATLDFVTDGRAGVRVRVSRDAELAVAGRLTAAPPLDERLLEAADHVEVQRRLWDSWDDDAEIRDAATGRFIDTDRLHYIDFDGKYFSVKGPSITPRPPQGQPIVTVLAHAAPAIELAAVAADVVFLTPKTDTEAAEVLTLLAAASTVTGRSVLPFADLLVYLDTDEESGRQRRDRLDALSEHRADDDTQVFTGSVDALADLLERRHRAGFAGFRLRPAVLPTDLQLIVTGLVPALISRGLFRTSYEADTLRGLLALDRPPARWSVPSGTPTIGASA